VLPGLVMLSTPLVTLLGDTIPNSLSYGEAINPDIVCLRCWRNKARFLRTEPRSVRLPIDKDFSRFGTVSEWNLLASPYGPLMVELFAVLRLTRTPDLVLIRSLLSPTMNSPRQPS